MAITLTSLLGTNSISSDRITINNNFATLSNAVNLLLQITNISTGAIDNSTFGSGNSIRTVTLNATNTTSTNLTVTNNITISSGNVIATNGVIQCGNNKWFQFGADPTFTISKAVRSYGSDNTYIMDLSGSNGGSGNLLGGVTYLRLPNASNALINSITVPDEGSICYDSDIFSPVVYLGSGDNGLGGNFDPSWHELATKDWIMNWVSSNFQSL
jgi:hypothetical protein